MRFTRHYSITKGELNMAPLIDVVLLQLIYFMLTSSFIMQPGIKINLPQAATTEIVKEQEVFISVSEKGVIFYRDAPVTAEELSLLLSKEKAVSSNLVLILKGDRKAEHGVVVQVMDIARRAGINRIAIATMPEF
ncbi:MAG TPA: biopolymer transporter ExbD [bacterium]|nr:biopolymer transporter ExbD [bacterium]